MNEWMEQAACRDEVIPTAWFFVNDPRGRRAPAGREAHYAPAKAVCGLCPVRKECLEHALEHHETHGVWGGLSPKERHRIRMGRR